MWFDSADLASLLLNRDVQAGEYGCKFLLDVFISVYSAAKRSFQLLTQQKGFHHVTTT